MHYRHSINSYLFHCFLSAFKYIFKIVSLWETVKHFLFFLLLFLAALGLCPTCRVSLVEVASLVAACALEHRLSSRPVACGILFPEPGTEAVSPALAGRLLTTGPPGRFHR